MLAWSGKGPPNRSSVTALALVHTALALRTRPHAREDIGPVGGESGSTENRALLLVFLKGFRASGLFLRAFRAFGTPKLVEGCHLTTALIQWLADRQI